ncbi:MAG: hypothetical protein J0I93_05770 [Legionella sp.]|nr:hypothetical protein [Legionella sp.]
MQTLYEILGLVGAGLVIFVLYKFIKGNPGQFSRENLSKSFLFMGLLALLLIAFIALLIIGLNNT